MHEPLRDADLDRLRRVEEEYLTLEAQLADPEVLADPAQLRTLSKRYNDLGPVIIAFRRRIVLGDDLEATVSFAAAPAPYLLLVADADAGAGGYRQLSHDGYRLTCCVRPRSAPPTSQ